MAAVLVRACVRRHTGTRRRHSALDRAADRAPRVLAARSATNTTRSRQQPSRPLVHSTK